MVRQPLSYSFALWVIDLTHPTIPFTNIVKMVRQPLSYSFALWVIDLTHPTMGLGVGCVRQDQ